MCLLRNCRCRRSRNQDIDSLAEIAVIQSAFLNLKLMLIINWHTAKRNTRNEWIHECNWCYKAMNGQTKLWQINVVRWIKSSYRCKSEERVVHRKETRAETTWDIARLEQDRRLFSFVERREQRLVFRTYLSTSEREEGRSYDRVVSQRSAKPRRRTARFLSSLLRDGSGVRRVDVTIIKKSPHAENARERWSFLEARIIASRKILGASRRVVNRPV